MADSKKTASTSGQSGLSDEDFINLFNGLYEIDGGGAKFTKALDYLSGCAGLKRKRVIQACIVFLEKPTILLMTGSTKRKAVGQAVNDRVAGFLPKIPDADMAAMDPVDAAQMARSRHNWSDAFKKVNMSQVKSIALIALALTPAGTIEHVDKWRTKYGGTSLDCPVPSGKDQTSTIRAQMLQTFRSHQKVWDTGAAKLLLTQFA